VALAEDFREHRQAFLAAIFLVAGDADDVFARAGSDYRRVSD